MISEEKKVRYPENLYLKALFAMSPYTIQEMADKITVSRNWLNLVVNGHQKGENTVSQVLEAFGPEFLEQYKDLIPKN